MWGVQFNPCGWSSRWYVAKPHGASFRFATGRDMGLTDWRGEIVADFANERDAKALCDKLNERSKG